MLNEEEQKELKKLYPELREKVEAMFNSPYYMEFEILDIQIKALHTDVSKKAFTIRGSAENENAKAEYDSLLKTLDKLDYLVEMREKARAKLPPDLQQKVNKTVTASSLREEALGGK